MIRVKLDNAVFEAKKDEHGILYWEGVSGWGPHFPGRYTVAPRCIYAQLNTMALENGADPAFFAPSPRPEKDDGEFKLRKNQKSISIFAADRPKRESVERKSRGTTVKVF